MSRITKSVTVGFADGCQETYFAYIDEEFIDDLVLEAMETLCLGGAQTYQKGQLRTYAPRDVRSTIALDAATGGH